jgi:hypothetical protein
MCMCRTTFGLDKTESGTSKSREGVLCRENSLVRRMNDHCTHLRKANCSDKRLRAKGRLP